MDMANPPDSGTSSSTSDEDSFPSLVEAATSPSESSEASSWETASSSSERSDEDSMPELADATSSSSESDGGAVYPAGLRRRRPPTSYVERRRSASEASEAGSGDSGAAPRDPLERYMAAVHRVRREHMLATAEMPSDSDAAHASDDERDRADAAYEERQALMCFEFAVCALRRSLRFTYSMPQVRRRQRLPAMEAG